MAPEPASIGDWLNDGPSDPHEVAGRYDEWAQSYDDDLDSWSYQAPTVVADTVLARHAAAGSVLDVGCGTGLVGRALRARGFTGRVVGVDISQASLDLAREGEPTTPSTGPTSSSGCPSRTTPSTRSSAWA